MGSPRYLSRIIAIVLLLVLQQQPTSVNALLLLPLPGYFLAPTLLKNKQTQSTKKFNPFRRRSNVVDDDTEDSTFLVKPPTPPSPSSSIGSATSFVKFPGTNIVRKPTMPGTNSVRKPTSERDMMIARAAKLRQSIVQQQDELITLERKIACCSDDGETTNLIPTGTNTNHLVISGISYSLYSSASVVNNLVIRLTKTFRSSSNVFLRKIDRVQKQVGPNNQKYEGKVGAYLFYELLSGLRIASKLATEPAQITKLLSDPRTPTLVPHAPAILARLDKLEAHVRPIIKGVLNDRQHLASIEPYLDEILERFDDIEPHLPWILENIDALAPYTGLLLKHIDALLLYADADNMVEDDGDEIKQYSLADQLLPYLKYYVSKLDTIGPHLVLLRPHIPLLLKHNRIAKVSPHIDKLFARGYETRLTASANIDVLLFWLGWTLRIPFAPKLFFALPFSPHLVSFLSNRLPKRFARRGKSYCRNLECAIDDDYGGAWNKLDKA